MAKVLEDSTFQLDAAQDSRAAQEPDVKIAIALLAAVLLGPMCAFAQPAAPAAPPAASSEPAPTDDSIRQLLQLTDVRSLIASMRQQMKSVYSSMVKKMLEGQTIPQEKQQLIDASLAKIDEAEGEMLSWERLEPLYIKVYQQTFTQVEVDGMIAFYASPAGQAVVHKMPLAVQNTMSAMQQQVASDLIPKLQQITQDLAKQLKGQSDQ
jgi:hypothetical protein